MKMFISVLVGFIVGYYVGHIPRDTYDLKVNMSVTEDHRDDLGVLFTGIYSQHRSICAKLKLEPGHEIHNCSCTIKAGIRAVLE